MERKLRGFVLTLSILLAVVFIPTMLFAAQIRLAWDANSEPDLAGYRVYYGTASRAYGTPINVGNVTSHTITGLTTGQTYYLAVTAYDNASPANESTYSTEVSGAATDPTQTVSITVTTNPAGLQVVVDSATYTAPRTFSWTAGSSHSLSLSSPQTGVSGTRYVYSSWSDGGAQSHSITVPSSAATYTANLTTQYSLSTSTNPTAGGSVSPSGTNWYNHGQTLNLSATANAGYNFTTWAGVISGTANPVPVTMDAPKSATAYFAAVPSPGAYTLTVNASPSGSGSVSVNPVKTTYSSGEQVTLTANANSGYAFSSWSGGVTGTTNPITVTMNANKTVTANFAATPGVLAVTPATGLTSSGPIEGPFSPSGTSYVLQNTGGTALNWTASATQSWTTLSASSGSLAPGANVTVTVSININAATLPPGSHNDTVSFTAGTVNVTRPVTLNVTAPMMSFKVGTNPSRLTVVVDGVEYKSPKTFTWAVGSKHTLDASSPQIGKTGRRYLFKAWSDGQGKNHEITASASSTAYSATFTSQYSLTTSVNIPEGGTVSVSGPTTSGENATAATGDTEEGLWYDEDTLVTLTATPNFEYSLYKWSNGSKNNSLSLAMTGPKKIKATFRQNIYKITILKNSLGTITMSPKKSAYVYGDQVTFTATPRSGYLLGSWTGDVSGAQNPLVVTVTGSMNVGANFTTPDGPPMLPSGDSVADASADNLTLIGELESPIDGKTISGVKPIYGWALDEEGISKVELFIDGAYACDIPHGGVREDIAAEHPQYPDADKSGFAMIWNYSAMSPGEHALKVRVHNLKGETLDLATTVVVSRFYAETVNQVTPQGVWVYDVNVTGDGTTKKYDVKLEWSDQTQGFEIIELVPR